MTIEAAPAPAFLVGASPSKEASDVGVSDVQPVKFGLTLTGLGA